MQTQATVSKDKEKTPGGHKPYSNPQVFVRPAAAKQPDPVEIIRRVRQNPASLSREDKLALQRTLGNRAVVQLLSSLKDSRKEEDKAEKNAGTKPAEQGQGNPENTLADREPALPEPVQEPRPVPAQAEVQQVSPQPEPKTEDKAEAKHIAAGSAAAKAWVNPSVGGSPSGAGDSKGKLAPGQPDGKAKAAAPRQAEAKTAPQGNEAETDQPADAKAAKNAKEATAPKADKETKPANEAKESKGESAQKGAAKEPSLGAALGALAGDGKEEPAKARKVTIHGEDPGQILDQLTQVQPTELGDAYAQAVNVSAGAFAKQKQKTKQGMPAVPAPTGLKGKVLQARKKPGMLKHAVPEGFKSERTGGAALTGNLNQMNIGSSGPEGNPEAIMGEIRSAAAQPPGISLTGEADPSQLEGFNQEASREVGAAKQAEMGQINHPFGENDIYPEPDGSTLKSSAELQGGAAPAAKKLPVLGLPADMTAGLNRSLAPEMKKQLGSKQAEYSKEKEKFDTKVQLSKADSHAQIQQAEADARNKQLSQQAGAKSEVDNLRGEWKNELDAAEADYAGQAGAAAQQKKAEINSVRTEKEREAQKKQSEAEREATQAYSKAKKEADGKHEEEKAKEEKKGGFLGWVKDKLEAVVNIVKKAVNFIFEGLRKAVKFIFEKAKQAVLGIIELGRKLITTLIKGLGALLKKLVSVVFAKFPGIAAKICSKIDGVVDKAVKAVNQLAQKLKTKVTQVMDFLAAKVDQALAAVQNFYTKLISTLGNLFIATFLDVLARIGALGKAAKRSLSHLEGKMWEYLLGVDISKPMGAAAAEGEAVEEAGPAAEEKLTAEDIEMESVEEGEMDPALVQEANLKDGETKELSGSRDPATMDSILAEFDTGKENQSLGGKIADGAKLRANNAKMLFDQIKSFVIKWMKAHGLQLLAAVAGILVTVGAALVITGGSISVLIGPIINAITVLMEAQAIVSVAQTLAQASVQVGTYLVQGWQKMIEPAAIALATAMAMGLVELAMVLGMRGLGKGLNKAGTALKKGSTSTAKKGVKAAAGAGTKGIKGLLKSGANLVSKTGSMIIRNGKIVIKSLKKGFMKGAKKLQDLVGRILQKFKFKKFELERKKDHIILYGVFNPRIKLMDLKIKDPDKFQNTFDKAMEDAARKQPKYNRKPNEPRNYINSQIHEDGTITYTFLSKKNGKEYKVKYDANGYPILDSKHDITLPEKYYLEPDKVQFDYLSKELYKDILENPELAQKFTAAERALLKEGKVPETLTWHHHQDSGRMQIIDYFEHQISGHTGGRAIWGGGRSGRKGEIKKKILEMLVWE